MGCPKAQRFSRTVIEFVHDILDFGVGDGAQITVFGEVLSNEPVGVLVRTTLPGGIRMREADAGLKVSGHAFMVGEFPAIVIGEGMHPVLVRGEAARDGGSDRLRGFARNGLNDAVAGLAPHQRHQGTALALADHGVTVPVTQALADLHDGRTRIDRHRVGYAPAPLVAAIALAPGLLTAQATIELPA